MSFYCVAVGRIWFTSGTSVFRIKETAHRHVGGADLARVALPVSVSVNFYIVQMRLYGLCGYVVGKSFLPRNLASRHL
jgi:hypothetical protein